MTPEGHSGFSSSLVMFAMGTVFVFSTAAACKPTWWIALAAIGLLGTGIGAFGDFRRRGR